MTIESVADKFDRVKKTATGFVGRCPAHDDQHASLSLWPLDNGGIGIKCHANCEKNAILAAVGLRWADLCVEKSNGHKSGLGEPEAIYSYHSADGTLLYQVGRFAEKQFRQWRPDGAGGRIWNLNGVTPVPFRLPRVLKAAADGDTIFVCEGEKDVLALEGLSPEIVATTNSGGAGKWRKQHTEALRGAGLVVLLPDNDDPGRDHAEKVAAELKRAGIRVKIVALPGLKAKGADAADWVKAGGRAGPLLMLAAEAPEWEPSLGEAAPGPNRSVSRGGSAGSVLTTEVLDSGAELFHCPDQEAWATVPIGDHVETMTLTSRAFQRWMAGRHYKAEGSAASREAIAEAVTTLGGLALFDRPQHTIHTRIAGDDTRIWVDLGDAEHRAVEIDAAGFRVVSRPPVRFRRPRGLLPLPLPLAEGSLDRLRLYVNHEPWQWPLVVAWLIAAVRPKGPYPAMALSGEHGASKSTVSRALRRCIDPNTAGLRSEPKEARDLAIAASNAWVVALDNLSGMPVWLSDALCRLSTGGGFATRQLHTDAEEVLFDAQRPVILNGIGETAGRPDLLDRSLCLSLPAINGQCRRTETEFWAAFEQDLPYILAGLYSAVSMAIRNLPTTNLASLPRMADFALWSVAAEPGAGLQPGDFLTAYGRTQADANALALEGSPFGRLLIKLVEEQAVSGSGPWEGQGDQLLEALGAMAGDTITKSKLWPDSAEKVGHHMRRITPNLRVAGIGVTSQKTRTGKVYRLSSLGAEMCDGLGDGLSPESAENPQTVTLFDGYGDGCDGCDGSSAPTHVDFSVSEKTATSRPDQPVHGIAAPNRHNRHTVTPSGIDALRSQILLWAEGRNWSVLTPRGGLRIGPGEDAWRSRVASATEAQLQGLLSLVQGGAAPC